MTDVTNRPTERERQHALIVEQAVELDRLRRSNAALLEACQAAATTIEAMMYRAKNENRARDYSYLSDRFECVRAAIERNQE